jgi:hypothetical protein
MRRRQSKRGLDEFVVFLRRGGGPCPGIAAGTIFSETTVPATTFEDALTEGATSWAKLANACTDD